MYMYCLQELWGSIWHFYIVLFCLIRTDSGWSTILPSVQLPWTFFTYMESSASLPSNHAQIATLPLHWEQSTLPHILCFAFLSTNNFLLSLRQSYLLGLYFWQICFISYVYSISYTWQVSSFVNLETWNLSSFCLLSLSEM